VSALPGHAPRPCETLTSECSDYWSDRSSCGSTDPIHGAHRLVDVISRATTAPLDAVHSQARRAPVGCRPAWSLAGSDRVGTRPEPCLFRPVRPHRNTGAQPSDDVRTATGIVVSRRARGPSPVFEGTARGAGEHPSCIPHFLSPSWESLLRPPASLHPQTPCLSSSSWAPDRVQACRTSRASPRRRGSRCAAHARQR
jgi:hypothetical protein